MSFPKEPENAEDEVPEEATPRSAEAADDDGSGGVASKFADVPPADAIARVPEIVLDAAEELDAVAEVQEKVPDASGETDVPNELLPSPPPDLALFRTEEG